MRRGSWWWGNPVCCLRSLDTALQDGIDSLGSTWPGLAERQMKRSESALGVALKPGLVEGK